MEAGRHEKSDPTRAYLHNHSRVTLHHGGAILDHDAETVVGGLMSVEAPSPEAMRSFVADSPFAKAGMFAESHVQPWDWLTGRPG